MRRILITLTILVLFVIALSALWIFRGRQVSLFIDRFGTIETASERINSIAYEGSGTGAQQQMISLLWQPAERFSLSVRRDQERILLLCHRRATMLPLQYAGAFSVGQLHSISIL